MVEIFLRRAGEYLGDELVNTILDRQAEPLSDNDGPEEDNPNAEDPLISVLDCERQVLPFPSAVDPQDLAAMPNDHRQAVNKLRDTELQLRQGHAEDSLEVVRASLIQLSWVFKNKVRGAEGAERTRSYDRVNVLTKIWRLQRRVYNVNRRTMFQLGDHAALSKQFPELLKEQCKLQTAVDEPNARGQSSHRLPWFWSSERGGSLAEHDGKHRDECEHCNIIARCQLLPKGCQSSESIGFAPEHNKDVGQRNSFLSNTR